MKKLAIIAMTATAAVASAQDKGRFEVLDFGGFKLHAYYSNDVMGDMSYIVEGKDGLVTLEEPLFKDNVSEFQGYVEKLGKPVVQRIADYHLGGTGDNDLVMAEGMKSFSTGPIYGGMMAGFAKTFGGQIVALPTGKVTEAPFGSTQNYAGVEFEFAKGATSDFPAASIIIGKKVYLTHWCPAKAHMSHLQLGSVAALDAEIAEAEKSLKSGAECFVGCHGGVAKTDAVEFKISYLKKLKELVAANKDADSLAKAIKAAFPSLPGEEGVEALAKVMY